MKTFHVITSTNIGGAQIMLERYLFGLGAAAQTHEVVSLFPDGPIAVRLRAQGIKVTSLGVRSAVQAPRALLNLRARLRASAPDVVHGWMYHGCLASALAVSGMTKGRPGLVWGIHHSLQDVRSEKRSTRVNLRVLAALSHRVDIIVYCSESSHAQHAGIGFCDRNVRLIPNAIDTSVYRPDPAARARLGALCDVPEDRLLIGNVARNHPMKDHVAMVRAIDLLISRGHDVQAVIIGEGHADGPAAAEARRLGLTERVSLLEARHDLDQLVPGLDVFLLSSAWGEAFPLAVTEAMAAGVPCVVTDVGDCSTLVGEAGLVVPPGDAAAQARAVEVLIAAGVEGRSKLGRAGRARVANLYSTGNYIRLHDATYRDAATHPAKGPERSEVSA